MRQLNYCSIMVGAVAGPGDLTDADRKKAENASRVASIALDPTNRGIRAYYFGLALLAWHIHPFALMVSAVLVVAVLPSARIPFADPEAYHVGQFKTDRPEI